MELLGIPKNGSHLYRPREYLHSLCSLRKLRSPFSASIGDWYPERNIFQILIAINSGALKSALVPARTALAHAMPTGPRFALVLLQYYLRRQSASLLPLIVCITGIVRTLSCGGWVYITSTDDHDVHDVLMILYIVCNIPWMFGNILCTPKEQSKLRIRRCREFTSVPMRLPC